MNWNLFDYAGYTALAYTALAVSFGVVLAVLGTSALLLWRRKWIWAAFPVPLLVLWGILWWIFAPRLDHAWLYLQENARRSAATYAGLTFATAFMPPSGETGRGAFVHIATRDTGFAKGRPVAVRRAGGHTWATFADEDYPGGVTTFDARPVETGYRFRGTRLLVSLIPLFEMPTARTARVEGAEAWLYARPLGEAGLTLLGAEKKGPADIVLVAPGPDWEVGADTPSVSDWRRIADGLARGGVAALHLDARLLSRARLKRILADFRAVFRHYRLWCTGRHDYVLTAGGNVLADEVLDLFANEKASAAFVAADAIAPGEVFACYMGTDFEIEPGLLDIPSFGRTRAVWTAPRLAVEHWAAAAALNPRDPLLRGLADSLDLEGRRFLRIGNVNAAIRCYENRLLIRPQDVAAVHNFGVCLKKSGHFDMAASVFAKAVTLDPRTDEHRLELVECCAASHREDMACRQLDVLMKRHPSDPALKMRAAKLLALKSNKAHDEVRAVALAEEAVRLTGWKDRAYVQALADVYIEVGRVVLGMGLKKKMREMRFEK